MRRIRLIVAVCAVAVAGVAGTAPMAAQAKPTITMSGSTSVFPLATQLARAYGKRYRHSVKFKILQGGSDVGVADAGAGRVSIGMSSRDRKPGDPGGLRFTKIARDAICVVTNRSNPIANLTQGQVQSIFSGRTTSWGGVAGSSISGSIDLLVREPGSGTQDAFQKIFMGDTTVSSSASQKTSNGLVAQGIRSDPKAIGYVSLDFVGGLSAAAYNGVPCTVRNAKAGTYRGTRNFWFVTRGAPKGAARKFIRFARGRIAQRRIVSTHWVPLR